MSDDGDYKDDDFGDNPDGGDDGGQGDPGDGGDGGDAGDGGDGGDPGDGDGGLGDGDEGIDDDGLEPGDEDLDKEADEEPKQISDNLPLTIEEQGLDENQKLRKWKDLLGKHIQNVQQYRAKNNNLRGQLKKLGDKAEKLVQSNVRKQKLLDQKLESKHTYLAENKILIEITKNKKPISDFTDKIPKAILEKMVEIYNKEQSNASMREQIKSLKDRNKNLNQNESVNQLTNDLVLIEKQIQDEEKLKKKFDLILIEQQAALKQQQMDCDYEGRLKNLQKETKEIKDKIKEYQKKELNSTRREIELNNHYARLQKIYRKMCEILNKPCEDQKFLYRQKDEQQQPHEESKASKTKEFSKKINEGNQKARFEMKANAVEKESEDELNKALKEFRDNKEEKFKELQENVKKLTEELDTKEKESQKQKKQLQEDQMKLQEEIGQLIKQMKEKEFEAKSTVTQLNDLNRQKQLTDKKPVSEPTLSTLNKPETIMFGNDQKTETCLPFNDYKNLDWGQNLPIHKIEICKNKKDLIVGLELYYGADASPETKITKHIGQLDSDIDKVTVEIDKDDKINYVSGFYNADQIIFLKFETTKKKITSIGNMKYKDATTKDFRIDIKDREIIGFCGVLDYTSESQNPSERFLVAFGLNLKGKEMDIKTKKRLKKQQDLEEQEKKRIPVDYRKITYPFKRNPPKHLDLIKSQPKLDVSVQDQERMQYYYKQKERIIQAQRTQLGLASAKLFSPTTFRTSEYLKEEQMRREKSEKRREWLEKKREENKSSQLLPLIEHKTPAEKDKKDKKADKNASPQKQQQKAPAKKDDPKAKKK